MYILPNTIIYFIELNKKKNWNKIKNEITIKSVEFNVKKLELKGLNWFVWIWNHFSKRKKRRRIWRVLDVSEIDYRIDLELSLDVELDVDPPKIEFGWYNRHLNTSLWSLDNTLIIEDQEITWAFENNFLMK